MSIYSKDDNYSCSITLSLVPALVLFSDVQIECKIRRINFHAMRIWAIMTMLKLIVSPALTSLLDHHLLGYSIRYLL